MHPLQRRQGKAVHTPALCLLQDSKQCDTERRWRHVPLRADKLFRTYAAIGGWRRMPGIPGGQQARDCQRRRGEWNADKPLADFIEKERCAPVADAGELGDPRVFKEGGAQTAGPPTGHGWKRIEGVHRTAYAVPRNVPAARHTAEAVAARIQGPPQGDRKWPRRRDFGTA